MRWGVLILFGVFFISFASAVIPDDCDDSMVAYWKFDNNILDSYGGYNAGTWASADYGLARVGNGSNFSGGEAIEITGVNPSFFSSSFTTEMWVNVGTAPNSSLFEKGGYKIEWIEGVTGFGMVNVTIGGVSINSGVLSTSTLYHVAVVWVANPGVLILYVNGDEEDSVVLALAGGAGGPISIGKDFVGLIDELAVYSGEGGDLDNNTIKLHYELGLANRDYCDPSGAGGTSSTKAVFNIRGCNFLVGGEIFGLARGLCSTVKYVGEYFCDEDQRPFITSEYGRGCTRANDDYEMGIGDAYCCPPGFFCNESESGGMFRCDRRPVNCFDQENEDDCFAAECNWWGEEEGCQDGMRDLGCGYYDSELACTGDVLNLGKIGIGTELCGTTIECNGETFSVPEEDCACAWFDEGPEDKKCQVKLVGTQMFYDPDGTPDRFECSNAYDLGDCTDGEQNVTWTSTNKTLSGFAANGGQVTEDCLEALNCNGGEATRFCGEPIIKLPGFSLFAFFASLFIVGMYYFVKESYGWKVRFK